MLQWMAEGDRLHEDPKHHGLAAVGTPRRSMKQWAAAGWAVALVFAGRFVVQHLSAGNAPAAAQVSAPVAAPPGPVPAALATPVPAPAPAVPVSPPVPVAAAVGAAAVPVEAKPAEPAPLAPKPMAVAAP